MGRKPKPSAIRKLEGNPGHRALNNREPMPDLVVLDPPWYLDDVAAAEWIRIVETLPSGLITGADINILGAYCVLFARWHMANEIIAKEGLVAKSPSGYACPHPAVSIANQSFAQMMRAASECGFTPAARSKVHVGESRDDARARETADILGVGGAR